MTYNLCAIQLWGTNTVKPNKCPDSKWTSENTDQPCKTCWGMQICRGELEHEHTAVTSSKTFKLWLHFQIQIDFLGELPWIFNYCCHPLSLTHTYTPYPAPPSLHNFLAQLSGEDRLQCTTEGNESIQLLTFIYPGRGSAGHSNSLPGTLCPHTFTHPFRCRQRVFLWSNRPVPSNPKLWHLVCFANTSASSSLLYWPLLPTISQHLSMCCGSFAWQGFFCLFLRGSSDLTRVAILGLERRKLIFFSGNVCRRGHWLCVCRLTPWRKTQLLHKCDVVYRQPSVDQFIQGFPNVSHSSGLSKGHEWERTLLRYIGNTRTVGGSVVNYWIQVTILFFVVFTLLFFIASPLRFCDCQRLSVC